jgi:hypothetical protein
MLCTGLQSLGLTFLDLSNNNLSNLTNEQWQLFLNTIKASSINQLSVCDAGLSAERIQELKAIIADKQKPSLGLGPQGLKNLCLSYFWSQPNSRIEKTSLGSFFESDTVKAPLDKFTESVVSEGMPWIGRGFSS